MKKSVLTWIALLAATGLIFTVACEREKPTAVEKKILKIGCITILSGQVATYGKETKQGVDLAIEEANQSGMFGDRKIEVVYEDSRIDAKTGTQAINKLIHVDRTPIIIGAFSSRVTLAIAPIAERSKTILLSASSTADAIKDAGDYIFRIVPPNRAQGTTAAKFALNKLGKRTVAIYYVNDEYGVSLAAEFKKAYEGLGGKVVFYDGFAPGQKDFRSTLMKIKKANPDMVFFPGQAAETGLIMKQSKELGFETTFIGGDGSYSPDLIKIAGKTAEGSYYTLMAMGFGVSDDLIEAFTERFQKKYGEDPTVYAAYAYEAGKIVAYVLSKAEYDAESIKNELYKIKNFKGITGLTSFDEYGEVDKEFYLYEVKEGKFEMVNVE